MTRREIQAGIERLAPWFYEFDLGEDQRTPSALPPEVKPIFSTRLEMVNRAIEAHFSSRLPQIRCVDVGCHEGFYSVAMARQGLAEIVGLDVREESLEKARFVAAALGLGNVRYQRGDCEDLSCDELGTFDLCLFLGILYHLENPMRCLRNVSRLTEEICVVETQVVEEVEGSAEWGARDWTRPYQGVLALVDESGEYSAQNPETGATPVATCPSPKALEFMLKQAGFRKTEFVEPPANAYEQHQRRKRVVCVAYK